MKTYTLTGRGEKEFGLRLTSMAILRGRTVRSAFLGTDGRWAISVETERGVPAMANVTSTEGVMEFEYRDMRNLLVPQLPEEGEDDV